MIRKPCKLDTDFQRSIAFQRNIEVWIDEHYFMRENCKFWSEGVTLSGGAIKLDSSVNKIAEWMFNEVKSAGILFSPYMNLDSTPLTQIQ